MFRKLLLVAGIVMFALLLTGCRRDPQLANPASVFCEENGGTLEMRADETGGQVGYCLFPDGSECEEWAFFRGECQPGEN